MPLPNTPYASPTTLQTAFLDQTNAALGQFGVTPCIATGTNALTLSPFGSAASVPVYAQDQIFSAVIPNNSTGAVTAAIAGLAAINVYLPDGVTQATTGTLIATQRYLFMYDAALNSGAGGLSIIAPFVPGIPVAGAGNFALTSASYANQGTVNTYFQGNAAGNLTFVQVSLTSGVVGNLPVTNLAGGSGASATTFWRGDATWVTPAVGGQNFTLTSGSYANQGASNTYLQGNAAGNLAFVVRPIMFALSALGSLTANATFGMTTTEACTFPANFVGSFGTAITASSSAQLISINKIHSGSTTLIGTATYASGATSPTFVTTGATSQALAAGDIIEAVYPSPPDQSLQTVFMSLRAILN